MQLTISELSQQVSGSIIGNGDLLISSVGTIEEAVSGQVALLLDKNKKEAALSSQADVIIAAEDYINDKQNIIHVKNPRQVLPIILSLFEPIDTTVSSTIHETAVISKSAVIGSNVAIGPYCVIAENCEIGAGSILYPHVVVGSNTRIGTNARIYAGVSLYHHCIIGNNVIIHSGAVIGSDGFGYVPENKTWKKVVQIGRVVIEDDVEIGANTAIDRGAIGDTVIGWGTKIDNLVHVAHNIKIGKSCAIAGQVGFAGSTTLGDNVSVAGQAGFSGHIKIGNGCTILGKAGVTKDLAENQLVSGFPARDHREEIAFVSRLRRLPETVKIIKKILKDKGILDDTE
ncbi:MAG: UDP-3-O-(3-hydroxymyristoyl)glucosamine N-acyltransferase [Candidatus Margulisbacteria bacterium GWF2_38_17]|nr:MAG: UDP-3-O-(3-hydroxymyristoyl)glucosamine N-acyltransferase [Candidatus Margulisbacteria bacterium GWD2_39_127]OGI03659.1 MAG: UDP-3-O-(3-hydroxymyristoyl)glucosamine N-acyltransferase [Candidatus Margulisbacteria bacterium GWF2_38_17]OGI05651.1 MAG: UDP-3-O-(3-hydroxymyristoyl)glucosamine N-acyltransferase [Candidatus Margulisbacteria bacterium GWE2_39_32]